jgi:hypothetical protein
VGATSARSSAAEPGGLIVNEAEWRGHIEHVKELLRVPVRDDEEGVRHDCKYDIESLHNYLPNLVFESYQDWFDQEDDWLLRNLSLILTEQQDAQLLALLAAGDDRILLTYLQNTCVPEWQQAAAEGGRFATAESGEAAEPGAAGDAQYTGVENSSNWAASRTPGTYFYIFDGTQYRYSDFQQGADAEWQTLPVREEEAAARAQTWGDEGAWYTPTHGAPEYGDAYVYALDREGPWLSRDAVLSELAAAAAPAATVEQQPAEHTQAWGNVWTHWESDTWVYGLTGDGPWIYPDGETAQDEHALLVNVLDDLAQLLPDLNSTALQELAVRQIAATAGQGVH